MVGTDPFAWFGFNIADGFIWESHFHIRTLLLVYFHIQVHLIALALLEEMVGQSQGRHSGSQAVKGILKVCDEEEYITFVADKG